MINNTTAPSLQDHHSPFRSSSCKEILLAPLKVYREKKKKKGHGKTRICLYVTRVFRHSIFSPLDNVHLPPLDTRRRRPPTAPPRHDRVSPELCGCGALARLYRARAGLLLPLTPSCRRYLQLWWERPRCPRPDLPQPSPPPSEPEAARPCPPGRPTPGPLLFQF